MARVKLGPVKGTGRPRGQFPTGTKAFNVGQKDKTMDREMRKTLGDETTRVGKLKAMFGGLNPSKKNSK